MLKSNVIKTYQIQFGVWNTFFNSHFQESFQGWASHNHGHLACSIFRFCAFRWLLSHSYLFILFIFSSLNYEAMFKCYSWYIPAGTDAKWVLLFLMLRHQSWNQAPFSIFCVQMYLKHVFNDTVYNNGLEVIQMFSAFSHGYRLGSYSLLTHCFSAHVINSVCRLSFIHLVIIRNQNSNTSFSKVLPMIMNV